MSIKKKIFDFYDLRPEEERLFTGKGLLELVRTREIISSFLSRAPIRVADIGGGPGEYSFWLAEMDHLLDLYDVTPRHIELAGERNRGAAKPLYNITLADARSVPCESGLYDLILLHGPLYHLPERDDRLRALAEARRVLKEDGLVICFGISYTSSTMVGLQKGTIFEDNYLEMIESEIKSGFHTPPTNFPRFFTDVHFHRPGELQQELSEVGFHPRFSLAVQGPSWLVPDFEEAWKDLRKREILLSVSRLLEDDVYNSNHFAVVATASPDRTLLRASVEKE